VGGQNRQKQSVRFLLIQPSKYSAILSKTYSYRRFFGDFAHQAKNIYMEPGNIWVFKIKKNTTTLEQEFMGLVDVLTIHQ